MKQQYEEQDSEDFEMNDIDEFEDNGEGEDSIAQNNSQKSFKEKQRQRMSYISACNVKQSDHFPKHSDNMNSNNRRY